MYCNASVLDENYEIAYKPKVIDVLR
jgi:hypothetical protein